MLSPPNSPNCPIQRGFWNSGFGDLERLEKANQHHSHMKFSLSNREFYMTARNATTLDWSFYVPKPSMNLIDILKKSNFCSLVMNIHHNVSITLARKSFTKIKPKYQKLASKTRKQQCRLRLNYDQPSDHSASSVMGLGISSPLWASSLLSTSSENGFSCSTPMIS